MFKIIFISSFTRNKAKKATKVPIMGADEINSIFTFVVTIIFHNLTSEIKFGAWQTRRRKKINIFQ
ncbi:hypothetical protein C8N37_10562 [Sphingobacterium faecium]|nr:hypothetical protein C8N37_10562 [Sphingobacterium faecium]